MSSPDETLWYDWRFSRVSLHVDREQLRDQDDTTGGRGLAGALQPPRARGRRLPRDRAPPVLAEDPARKSAAPRRRPLREDVGRRSARALGRERLDAEGNLL